MKRHQSKHRWSYVARFEAGGSEKFLALEVAGSISNWQSQGAEVSAQLTAFRQNRFNQ